MEAAEWSAPKPFGCSVPSSWERDAGVVEGKAKLLAGRLAMI
jgi:hypothetical protein